MPSDSGPGTPATGSLSSSRLQAASYDTRPEAPVDKVVLVDGAKLAELMIDHDVGVNSRNLRLPRVDGDSRVGRSVRVAPSLCVQVGARALS